MAPRLSILKNTFVFTTPSKHFGDFLETWYKERSYCVEGELCLITAKGVSAPTLNFFFEKYFVFATFYINSLCDVQGCILQRDVSNSMKELWPRVKKVCGRIT
jgi:hypothetical protein